MERQNREFLNQELIDKTSNSQRGRERLGLLDHLGDYARLMLFIVPVAIGAAVLEQSLKAQGTLCIMRESERTVSHCLN